MSSGIVVCSRCNRVVHQDGTKNEKGVLMWVHCWHKGDERSLMCEPATAIYASNLDRGLGVALCRADEIGLYQTQVKR